MNFWEVTPFAEAAALASPEQLSWVAQNADGNWFGMEKFRWRLRDVFNSA